MNPEPLTAAVVGCRGMGRGHCRALQAAEGVELAAICDLDEAVAREAAADFTGVRVFTRFDELLAAERPDLLAIATPSSNHAELTIAAAQAGVRGLCCEKPMATNLGDARAMVAACQEQGAQLIINHQRRTLPQLARMRDLVRGGAVGAPYLLRGSCQGDLLSDGTHVIDSLLHLTGDEDAAWVFGQITRDPPPPDAPRGMGFKASGGYRYGHVIESGGWGTWQTANGLRVEVFCGSLALPARGYNDYEVYGSNGRLWRPGDRDERGLFLQAAGDEGWQLPVDRGETGEAMARNYTLLAQNVRAGGGDHPLAWQRALRGFEINMAIFESARLRKRIDLPLQQERFPLELMLDECDAP